MLAIIDLRAWWRVNSSRRREFPQGGFTPPEEV